MLIQMNVVTQPALGEVIVDAWLACAPPKLVANYLEDHANR